MRDKKKVIFLILTGSGGVRGHKKGHKKALSDISYEGPIRYLHQTLHIGVKKSIVKQGLFFNWWVFSGSPDAPFIDGPHK